MVEAIPPRIGGPCVVCGDAIGAEPHWVTAPDAQGRVHHRCRDWSEAPFPFGRQLRTLRRLVVELRGALIDVVTVGRELRRIERTWPVGGRSAYDGGAQRIAEIRERMARITDLARQLW